MQPSVMPQRIGDFVIRGELGRGQGGMSTIYLATAPDGRIVVLKVTHDSLLPQLENEAESLSALHHPNIVTLFPIVRGDETRLVDKAYIPDPKCYIVLEYVDGGNLKDWVQRGGRLSLEEIGDILGQVAEALDYAHQRGLVHLDVKPSNILLSADGRRVVLSDFGIVRPMGEQTLAGGRRPRFATPEYIPPEYASGKEIDGRADVYSLGIVLFELLAGHVPFSADTTESTMTMHRQSLVPVQALASYPAEVQRVVCKALEKRPEDRYPTAGAMIGELRGFLRRRFWRRLAVAVALVVLLGGGMGGFALASGIFDSSGSRPVVVGNTPTATAIAMPSSTVGAAPPATSQATPTLAPTPTREPTATPVPTPTPTFTPTPTSTSAPKPTLTATPWPRDEG